MITLLSLAIHPHDTPTAHIGTTSGKVSLDPATRSAGSPGTLFFESPRDARRWLEDALDAITDAERAAAREREVEAQERIAEARHEAEHHDIGDRAVAS